MTERISIEPPQPVELPSSVALNSMSLSELIAYKDLVSVKIENSTGIKAVSQNQPTTISGTHTYTTLPQSSVVPTSDNQFTNKKYVDDSIASAITTTLGGSF